MQQYSSANQEPTMAIQILLFFSSQAKWCYHSTSQPAYESPSARWYILLAGRSVPAGKFQTTKNIH